MMNSFQILGLLWLGTTVLLLSQGCSSTRPSEYGEPSGFLLDYDRLEEGDDGGAFWVSADFNLDQYIAFDVQDVEVRTLKELGKIGSASEDALRIATLFRDKTIARLQEAGWLIVDEPGERVAVLRMALTELDGANPIGNILVLGSPVELLLKTLSVAADTHVFVGKVSTEVQIVDANTGEVLVEALDRRVGARSIMNKLSTWGDVEDAIELWSERIADGLPRRGLYGQE